MAILHLMVGLPCSGKTTWAKQIEIETGAVRFTPDEWQTRLYGNDMHRTDHTRLHDEIEAIMGELADHLLMRGVDVVLDFGFWTKAERVQLRAHADALGVECVMHYAAASADILEQRRVERALEMPDDKFSFSKETLAEWTGLFEPPDAEERSDGETRQATI